MLGFVLLSNIGSVVFKNDGCCIVCKNKEPALSEADALCASVDFSFHKLSLIIQTAPYFHCGNLFLAATAMVASFSSVILSRCQASARPGGQDLLAQNFPGAVVVWDSNSESQLCRSPEPCSIPYCFYTWRQKIGH
jgi:hypothetical protein